MPLKQSSPAPAPLTLTDDVQYLAYRRPMARFAEVSPAGPIMVIEVPADVPLDVVLDHFGSDKPDIDLGPAFDTAVFSGNMLVATISHRDGQVPKIRRLDSADA